MITIRPASPNEIKKLQNLNDEAFADNPKFDPDIDPAWAQSVAGSKYFSETINSKDGCCLVAEDNGILVGYISASPKEMSWRKHNYIEIDNVGVAPSHRKRGLATLLMEKCLEWAKTKGYQRVTLSCYSKNSGALKFYKKHGFSEMSVELERDI